MFDVDFVTPNLVWEGEPFLGDLPRGGGWITGGAVAPLWEAVNQIPWGPVVEENGTYYLITLQVEDLSLEAPPTR